MKRNYSKLIPPEEFTVEYTWDLFRNFIMPKNAHAVQVTEMKKAYLSGFAECFKVMEDYAEALPEEETYELMKKLRLECINTMKTILGTKPKPLF